MTRCWDSMMERRRATSAEDGGAACTVARAFPVAVADPFVAVAEPPPSRLSVRPRSQSAETRQWVQILSIASAFATLFPLT